MVLAYRVRVVTLPSLGSCAAAGLTHRQSCRIFRTCELWTSSSAKLPGLTPHSTLPCYRRGGATSCAPLAGADTEESARSRQSVAESADRAFHYLKLSRGLSQHPSRASRGAPG